MKELFPLIPAIVALTTTAHSAAPKKKPALPDLPPGEPTTIRIQGSDTMLQLGLRFQEAYNKARPNVILVVNGEGSGVGFKALIQGDAHLAASSRPIKEAEVARYKQTHGAAPVEHVVAFDVIGVFVHPDNPVESLSLKQLRAIYTGVADWSEFAPKFEGQIKVASRSNTSATYAYFRNVVMGKGGPKMGKNIAVFRGSNAMLDFVGATPTAIGYTGIAYANKKVKVVPIADADGKAVPPTGPNVRAGRYPLRRPLYYYTSPDVSPELELFLGWMKSPAGQAIVKKERFTRLRP